MVGMWGCIQSARTLCVVKIQARASRRHIMALASSSSRARVVVASSGSSPGSPGTSSGASSWWRDRKPRPGARPFEKAPPPKTEHRGADKTAAPTSLEDELRGARRARGEVIALGVDYGARRIGVAVSNGGAAPRALGVIANAGSASTTRAVSEILRLARQECVDRIVVGVPKPPGRAAARGARGGRGGRGAVQMHVICARFAGEVADAAARSDDLRDVDVFTCDESLTSKEAMDRLEATGRIGAEAEARLDSVAAAVILERYFDGSYGTPKKVEPFK